MSSKAQIIESLRETLTKVVKKDFSQVDADESLNLDSINRISLIVELEWVYDIEIDSDGLDPEVFDTLNSLAGYIEGLVNESV
ncbi:MAG: phosphopantetheine-binding protein [Pseudomonadota bacterium]|jgi:acyl carrier protein|uniref:Acyl carrier protein n=1 Tax=Alteromonas alba TaxID=2079529 RepID=A0A2S9V7E2_9ALTE|nr:phosphopantetheine-binding protein [Alteromonas alba]MDG6099263.1 acyl carrier protein [Alteromonas sp. ZYF713]MDY6927785.1 phosphopantetheine-binding protein [Pseudomonadota bacterium]PRO72245.1 acyl carrier protein [Alteromonas alba]